MPGKGVPGAPRGPRPYFEAVLLGGLTGALAVAGLRYTVPNVYWIAAIVVVVIFLFLTIVFVPFVRLLLITLLGFFVSALAATALFLGRVL